MKRLLFFIMIFSSLACRGALFADEEVVSMNYVCRDLKGAVRWRANSEIKNISPGIYIMTEKAQGVYSSFKGQVSWVAEMKFERTEDNIRPISLDKRVFDAGGNVIRHERQEFDLAANTGICTHKEPARNISRTRKFKFNRDVVTRLSLGLYAQKFLESGKTSERLQMVSEEPQLYNIELKRMGRETIGLNGRKVAAYRLCVDPRLGVLNFVKVFLPRSYAWHSAVPEYEWLGYAGLEGGINSEKVEVLIEGL
ncbi:MAG: hypothetical protein WC482_04195 [Candidatus Omnitrophota bacterium]|nr:hypothetical protein [Candidatus Omnitrophota bacterium]